MKKIKLFALAAFAMLSTNAFAVPAWDATVKSTDLFTYVVEKDGGAETGNAKITGFVNGLTAAQMATLTIPATIEGEGSTTYNVTAIGFDGSATKFNGNTNITKIQFEASSNLEVIDGSAFRGCSALTTFDLTNASKLKTIGAKALAGTSIVTLDLSKTKVADMSAFEFCDKAAAGAEASMKKNITLTTLILWDQWTEIGADAFTNCTALESVNFQTANPVWLDYVPGATQTLNAKAFANTAIKEIDLSGTIVTAIPALTFNPIDATDAILENTALTTVKLNKKIATLNANFSNCTSLTSIDIENDPALVALAPNEFQYDAKLTSIDLKNITTLAANAFEGTGLTAVSFPKGIASIPANCFQDCASLATVTFAADYAVFTGIATMAFAGDTKLTAITIPACLTQAANAIADKAFFMCTGLKSVTFKPAAATTSSINAGAFTSCNDGAAANLIAIYTTDAYKTLAGAAPACTKWDTGEAPAADIAGVVFAKAKYANADKYYVKVAVPAAKYIKVKATSTTKVYEGYLDAQLFTLNMIPYLVDNGYYVIGDATNPQYALIITDNADIAYEDGAAVGASTSTLGQIAGYANALEVLAAATSATTLAAAAPAGQVIYGWVNSASKGTGWQNITSGTMPKDGLWCYAAKPAAGGRLNVVWLDENGNVDEELTAIQNVKAAKAENGAIYNLAGQKVNAAYKGVVIKDGKKYIQK